MSGVDKGFDQDLPRHETPDRYKLDQGDLIDQWAKEYSRDEFRAIMRAQVDKYYKRYGKKDNHISEAKKAADYANRLYEYEVKWLAEDSGLSSE